ncbi:MAG: hypothetical protein ABIP94_09440 [Planctomycetota bacterium]
MSDRLTVFAVSFLAACAIAQEPLSAVPNGICGVTPDGPALLAGGNDYTARFDAMDCVFTPLFGATVEHPHALRWRLVAVRRGDTVVHAAAAAPARAPEQVGCAVEYRRSADLVERYEVRPEGIEQKFVLAQRPAGAGDLLVELVFASDLPRVRAADGGLRFELDGKGAVTFGALTGVDANGASIGGRVHASEDRITLSLPGAFVDQCAYPLVLDPLIGSAFLVTPFLIQGTRPAVAFDETLGRYLVVWNTPVSGATDEIRGQYVAANGVLFSTMFTIATDARSGTRPSVANVNTTNRFLVAWCSSSSGVPFATGQIKVRSIAAGAASMSAVLTRSHLNSETSDVGVGGDARLGGFGAAERAMVVYRQATTLLTENTIQLWCVHVPATGNPTTYQNQEIASTTVLVEKPSVTRHCGSNGNWLVVYARGPSITGMADNVRARMVDAFGDLCGTTAVVASSTSGGDYTTCAATEDGIRFLVGWGRFGDISVRRIRWSGACTSGVWIQAPEVDPTSASQFEADPSLEFAGSKYVLSFVRAPNMFGIAQGAVVGLHLATGEAFGQQWLLESSSSVQQLPTAAAKASASASIGTGSDDDEALVVWGTSGIDSTIRARRFEAVGTGLVTSLGGACGIPGFSDVASYSGTPVIGTDSFALSLIAPTSPIVALIVGFSQAGIPCGACTVMPALDVLLPGVSPTPFPIPADPALYNVEIFTQWIQFRPSGCPLIPELGLSNALKFTIRE